MTLCNVNQSRIGQSYSEYAPSYRAGSVRDEDVQG